MAQPDSFKLASLLLPTPPMPLQQHLPPPPPFPLNPFLSFPPPPPFDFSANETDAQGGNVETDEPRQRFPGLLHAQLQYLNYLSLLGPTGRSEDAGPITNLSSAPDTVASLALSSPAKPEPARQAETTPVKTETVEDEPKAPTSPTPAPNFQEGVTVGYTYDALFISDGRSKRKTAEGKKERYECPQCGKSYATSSNLSRHKQTHRPIDSDQAKACPYGCGKVYVSMPALSMHVLTHKLEHKCGVCGKAFSRPWLLQGHMRSHSGLKPFGCAHCGKAFSDRSNLRAHMQTHSGEKKFDCLGCGKSFALKSYLNKHAETCRLLGNGAKSESGSIFPLSPSLSTTSA